VKKKPADARALIAEDDPSWQKVLSEILTDAGLAVDIVDNREAAMASLKAAPHRLAVVDLSLDPDNHSNRDGLHVLDAVQRLDPGCVTVLLTGYATFELAVSALTEHNVFTCLRKGTFHRAEFRELVSQALASTPPAETVAHASDNTLPGDAPTGEVSQARQEEHPVGLALVVEDDAGWRSILSELLTDAGYQTRLCSSFGEALGCLRREKHVLAVVDLSLADSAIVNPDLQEQNLDGFRLLASTRAAGIPAIVVSGVATPDHIERTYAEHAIFAFVEKQTFDRRAFLQIVQEAQAVAGACSEIDCLTRREREVLELLAQGQTNKEIAETLVITTNTVKRHLKSIFSKLDVHTRSAAAAKAVSAGVPVE
jgi:DNA-binding NarL/FixJ family response regulator